MRIIFAGGGTGGHLFPGLAVAREFQRRDEQTEILFVGTEQGIEFRVLPKEGFKLELLKVKGMKGRGLRGMVDALYGVPASVLCSLKIIRQFRPECVIGLGGYASGHPVMLPMIDVVEVGAGGGSIAWIDDVGALKVGPRLYFLPLRGTSSCACWRDRCDNTNGCPRASRLSGQSDNCRRQLGRAAD